VTDPYRTSGGTACPRCRNPLARESDDELNCSSGCGTWLGNKLIQKLVALETIARSSGNPFRATPLRPTRCLVCKEPLNDLYKGTVDVLTLGQCLEHGVWLEAADRSVFEAMYRPDIRERELDEQRLREVAQAQEQRLREVIQAEGVDPVVGRMMLRIEALETQVTSLKKEVADLQTSLARTKVES
jgi:polyhydroxyalkanoate synthesis regulator phasin